MKTELWDAAGAGDASRGNAPRTREPSLGAAATFEFEQMRQATDPAECSTHIGRLTYFRMVAACCPLPILK